MEVRFRDRSPYRVEADLLIFPVREQGLAEPSLKLLDRHLRGRLWRQIQSSGFRGAEGEVVLCPTEGKIPPAQVLLLGMGKEQPLGAHSWRVCGARGRKEASRIWAQEIAFYLPSFCDNPEGAAGPIVEGVLLAGYRFDKYRSNKVRSPELRATTLARAGLKGHAGLRRVASHAQDIATGVFLARDLINEPPSIGTASYLAEQAKRFCRGSGVDVEVWGKRKIQAMKLAGLLAVNRGSQDEPRFITIRYRPGRRADKKVALVGKGITFDSGGLSLKSPKSMEAMKLDMAGAAAIIGTMSVLPRIRPRVEVTAYLPTTDNLPSGSAQKPGDIIRYSNGKTVEVLNTDAEGRLILADALLLAGKAKPDLVVDLATLTGASRVALGSEVAAVFGNDQSLVENLIRCGREVGEKLWQLPLVPEYREELKSGIADIKNVGGAYGGAITAALFLQEFTAAQRWAHLDIAGPAFTEKDGLISPKGGTGFGALTLLRFLSTL